MAKGSGPLKLGVQTSTGEHARCSAGHLDEDQPEGLKALRQLPRCSRSSTPPIDNAQQRSRRKALMRNTAARCLLSTIKALPGNELLRDLPLDAMLWERCLAMAFIL